MSDNLELGQRTLQFQIPMLHGSDVRDLQKALVEHGDLSSRHADGRFNLFTRRALIQFEESRGLQRTGIFQDGDQSAAYYYLRLAADPSFADGERRTITSAIVRTSNPVQVVDQDWLDNSNMKKIVIHWTAGNNKASSSDRKHYHFMIEGDGTIVRGNRTPKDNESTSDGRYAAHTRGTNTGSIGLALCGMAGARERPFRAGPQPINETQWAVMAQVVAQLCKHYDIEPIETNVLGHGEVQKILGRPQTGKWDPMVLPWDTSLSHGDVGEKLRQDVRSALQPTDDDALRLLNANVLGKQISAGAASYDVKTWLSLPKMVSKLGWEVLVDEGQQGVILRAGDLDFFATAFSHIDPKDGQQTTFINLDDVAEALDLRIEHDVDGNSVLLDGEIGGAIESHDGEGYRQVTVRRGDTLSQIAFRLLNDRDRWIEFLNSNGIPFDENSARSISPGEQVLVPVKSEENPSESPALIPKSAIDSVVMKLSVVARPGNEKRLIEAAPILLEACEDHQINDPAHIAYLLATAEHETNFGHPMAEKWTNSAAQRRYEGKYGNDRKGDGKKYRGRGYVQLTFKYNYERFGKALGLSLVTKPSLAEVPKNAGKIIALGMKTLGYRSKNLVLEKYGFGEDFDFDEARAIINNDVDKYEGRYGTTRGKGIGAQARKYFSVLSS